MSTSIIDKQYIDNVNIIHKVHHLSRHVKISVKMIEDIPHVLVTRPKRVSEARAQSFVNEKMDWILSTVKKLVARNENTARTDRYISNLKHNVVEKRRLYQEARMYVEENIVSIATFYNVKINRISIRDTSSRWGSASARGNLNFSYKIIFLPIHLRQYIIIHEVCHLLVMNHSQKFWNEVKRLCPKYIEYRKELKQY